MAVLEAFVHDPLMSFHLLTAKYLTKPPKDKHRPHKKVLVPEPVEKSLIETYGATFAEPVRREHGSQGKGFRIIIDQDASPDLLNKTTQSVMSRISSKLNGTEFGAQRAELSLTELRAFSEHIGEDVFEILTLEGAMAARDHFGATAPNQVRAAVARARARLRDIRH